MKSRLNKIEIQNFKAFRHFKLDLEGRHLLLYGANGAGKSSLYWALYTFLQSASKQPQGVISKYFDSTDGQNLLNIHEQGEEPPKPGGIKLTLRDAISQTSTAYRISESVHASTETEKGTHNEPVILKGNLASDFITYRFFFGFSHFRNSENFDLWPLFEKEILPFCVSTGGHSPLQCWKRIELGKPNPLRLKGVGGSNSYDSFEQATQVFADMLPGIVDTISTEAQIFYNQHFVEGDAAKVELKLKVTQNAECSGTSSKTFKFTKPVISFGVRIGGQEIKRPQSFLNEAKLTQLALSIRFAASLVNLYESDLKLLVLDDLLVSFDMDNRMKVVEILLSDTFANYQKIILTHDLGFFREFKRNVDAHQEWMFVSLQGSAKTNITSSTEKTPLQKAEDFIQNHDLESAALQLRKAAEQTAQKYKKWASGETQKPGEFHTLTENLRTALTYLEKDLKHYKISKQLLSIPEEHRSKIIPSTNTDIDHIEALDGPTKGKIKSQQSHLRKFLTSDFSEEQKQIDLIKRILKMTERVLNPSAHWNDVPLYEAEVKKAQKIICKLENLLIKDS